MMRWWAVRIMALGFLMGAVVAGCGDEDSALPSTEVCEEDVARDAGLRTGDACECVGQEVEQEGPEGCTYVCSCSASGWFCLPCEATGTGSGPGISDETESLPELAFTGALVLEFVEGEGDPADGVARGDRVRVRAEIAVENSNRSWSDVVVEAETDPALELEGDATTTLDSLDREGASVSFVLRVRENAQAGPARLTLRASGEGLQDALPRVATFDVALGALLSLQNLRWRPDGEPEGDNVSELQPGSSYLLTGVVANTGAEDTLPVELSFLLENDDLELVAAPDAVGVLEPEQDTTFAARFSVRAEPVAAEASVEVVAQAGALRVERTISVAVAPPVSSPIELGWGAPERSVTGEDVTQQDTVLLCPVDGSGEGSAEPVLECTSGCLACGEPSCEADEGSEGGETVGTGTWTVEVTNEGEEELEGLEWTARILVLCETCDLVTDPQARCYGPPEEIAVTGPAALDPEQSASVEVTFSLTTRTSRYLGLLLTATRGASTTTEVFNNPGELWDRLAD